MVERARRLARVGLAPGQRRPRGRAHGASSQAGPDGGGYRRGRSSRRAERCEPASATDGPRRGRRATATACPAGRGRASALHCPGHGGGAHEGHRCRDRGRRHRGRIRGAPPRPARPPRHGARAGRDRLGRVGRQCGHDRFDRLGPCAGSAGPPHRGQPRPVQGDAARSWRGHRAPAVGLAPGHPHRGAARLRARPRGGAPRARACDRAARHPRRPEPRARPEPGAPRRRLLAAALPGRSRAGHAGLRAGRRAERAPASSPITK